jgi:hypothetical protein
MNGRYFIAARDGALWLVVEVLVDGDAAVLGRWTERADAEAECKRWAELAATS